jgi:hypothetical protein
LKQFVSSHKHTNILVLSVPQRHNLIPNSCVSYEVKIFNKSLAKLERVFPNLPVVTVDTDRDLHTRHGLHLNAHGKEHVENRIATMINDLLSQEVSPIIA